MNFDNGIANTRAILPLLAAGLLATTAGCSQPTAPATGEDTSDITSETREVVEHREIQCDLNDGRIARLFPDGSEIQFIDPQLGSWARHEGLVYEESPWSTTISNAAGDVVATISRHGYYSEVNGFEGNGSCANRSVVKTVAPTSTPIALDETLEYACTTDDESVEFIVRPSRGELDMIRVLDGRIYGLTGISFELTHVDGTPARNELTGRTSDGSPIQIVETEQGVTITESQIHGSCEKRERRPQS